MDSFAKAVFNKKNKNKNKNKIKKAKFDYIIKVADFYYKKSAQSFIKRVKNETLIDNLELQVITNVQYRVFLGPFKNINSLQKAFNDVNILDFENIEIIKND